MGIHLTDNARALVDAKNYATLATLNADGSPHTSVVWITRDDDDLLVSTLADRHKERNIRRDPRVSISVFDLANPVNYVEFRGTATITADEDRKIVNEVANKYTGADFAHDAPDANRVVIRVSTEKIAGHA